VSNYAHCPRCGFSLEENLAQLHALRSQIRDLEVELSQEKAEVARLIRENQSLRDELNNSDDFSGKW